jgi:hypothetical protein
MLFGVPSHVRPGRRAGNREERSGFARDERARAATDPVTRSNRKPQVRSAFGPGPLSPLGAVGTRRAIRVQLALRLGRGFRGFLTRRRIVDDGVQGLGDTPVPQVRGVLVGECRAHAVVAIRSMRSRSEAPVWAAGWFPVRRKSWKCRPGAPTTATDTGQFVCRLKLLRRSAAPLSPVKTRASGSSTPITGR